VAGSFDSYNLETRAEGATSEYYNHDGEKLDSPDGATLAWFQDNSPGFEGSEASPAGDKCQLLSSVSAEEFLRITPTADGGDR
jgi:hypothetical protein